jgi:multidrug efflux pump subunit AcrA (membrane-fusion protein)
MKKLAIRLGILGLLGGLVWGGYTAYKAIPQRQQQIATARVRKGDVIVRSYTRGELRAVRSVTLVAPNLFGTVQVTRLAPLGAFAKEKDLIVEFDDSEVNSRLEEKQLELEQIDEQIKKAQADLAIRNNQDQVELLRARYAVRRAELEVKRNELLPAIDQKKNLLNLEEARRRLKQLESDVKSRQEQAQAELAVLFERRNKARVELARERQRLAQVKLLAPMAGLVAIRQNRQTGFYFPGMQIPDIREGDQVQPGMPIADILDISELELVAKVGELDRAQLREGQEALVRLDAIGGKTFSARIKAMSSTASANVFSGDPAKKFDVIFALDMKELLTGLGAKPEQVQRLLATAEANRKKGIASSASLLTAGPTMMAMGGPGPAGPVGGNLMAGPPGAGSPTSMPFPGAMGPGGPGMGGGERGPGGPRRMMFGGPDLSEADRQKFREAMQKALNGRSMQDLTPEERQKIFDEVRKAVPALANAPRPAQGGGQRPAGPPAEAPAGPPAAGLDALTSRSGRGRGGEGGERRGAGPAGFPGFGFGSPQFSEKDLENAQLPEPPGPESQLDILIRPGSLADVEIIVEKIPNAIHIPAQAVFEKDGKPVVYVKNGTRWDERFIKPLRRAESTLVVGEGLKAGELIAMANPFEKAGDKKKKEKSSGAASSPMSNVGARSGGARP